MKNYRLLKSKTAFLMSEIEAARSHMRHDCDEIYHCVVHEKYISVSSPANVM